MRCICAGFIPPIPGNIVDPSDGAGKCLLKTLAFVSNQPFLYGGTRLGIGTSLGEFYYSLEDRYYDVVDGISKVLPIRGLVDAIDRVVPSFVLFLLLLLVLLAGGLYWLLNPSAGQAVFLVQDEDGNPLANASIFLEFSDHTQSLVTDSSGRAELAAPEDGPTVRVRVTLDDFETFEDSIVLVAKTYSFVLAAPGCVGDACLSAKPKTVTVSVVNANTGRLITDTIRVAFSCDDQSEAAPVFSTAQGRFIVPKQAPCDAITATVSAPGFVSNAKRFTASSPADERILLSPEKGETGTVNVRTLEQDGNAIPNVTVILENRFSLTRDEGITGLSGAYLFSNVPTGSYRVIANAADGRSRTSDEFEITANDNPSITLSFAPLTVSRMLRLLVVDAGTDQPVPNARVLVYQDDAVKYSYTTVQDGTLERPVVDTNAIYSAVVTHPDYLLQLATPLSVFRSTDTNAVQKLRLIRRSEAPPNYATAAVHVVDEDEAPVSRALVFIFDSRAPRVPLNAEPLYTGTDGNVLLSRLEPGSFFAYASKSDLNGTTSAQAIGAGETKVFRLKLILGEGKVEATIVDARGQKLGGAVLELFDSTSYAILGTCVTPDFGGLAGICTPLPIKADKFVLARASKAGYFSAYYPTIIDLRGGQTTKIRFQLFDLNSIPPDLNEPVGPNGVRPPQKIFLRLSAICEDAECRRPVNRIDSDPDAERSYHAQFQLFLSEAATYSDIEALARMGFDADINLPAADWRLRILSAQAVLANPVSLFSCYSPADPFASPVACPPAGGNKQAQFFWNDYSRVMFPIVVRFGVESGLSKGTPVEVHYRARAKWQNRLVQTPDLVRLISIGEPFCIDGVAIDSSLFKNNRWSPLSIDPSAPTSLQNGFSYSLAYWLYNCSGSELTSARLLYDFAAEPSQLRFSQAPAESSSGPITVGEWISFPTDSFSESPADATIGIHALEESGLEPLDANFFSSPVVSPNQRSFFLRVLPGKPLRVVDLPNYLPDTGSPELAGRVIDAATGAGVSGALVKIWFDTEPTPLFLNTDSEGRFKFPALAQVSSNTKVMGEAQAAGYLAYYFELPILPPVSPPSGGGQFGCLSINRSVLQLDRNPASANFSQSFTLGNSCGGAVFIQVASELVASSVDFVLLPSETREISVRAVLTPTQNGNHPLAPGQARIALGEYPVFINARLETQGQFTNAIEQSPLAFVNDAESPFRMVHPGNEGEFKYAYNIQNGPDSGLILNRDFAPLEDYRLPALSGLHSPNGGGVAPPQYLLDCENDPDCRGGPRSVASLGESTNTIMCDEPVDLASGASCQSHTDFGLLSIEPTTLEDCTGDCQAYTIPVADTFANLEVRHVDFFMTDLQHNHGDQIKIELMNQEGQRFPYSSLYAEHGADLPWPKWDFRPLILLMLMTAMMGMSAALIVLAAMAGRGGEKMAMVILMITMAMMQMQMSTFGSMVGMAGGLGTFLNLTESNPQGGGDALGGLGSLISGGGCGSGGGLSDMSSGLAGAMMGGGGGGGEAMMGQMMGGLMSMSQQMLPCIMSAIPLFGNNGPLVQHVNDFAYRPVIDSTGKIDVETYYDPNPDRGILGGLETFLSGGFLGNFHEPSTYDAGYNLPGLENHRAVLATSLLAPPASFVPHCEAVEALFDEDSDNSDDESDLPSGATLENLSDCLIWQGRHTFCNTFEQSTATPARDQNALDANFNYLDVSGACLSANGIPVKGFPNYADTPDIANRVVLLSYPEKASQTQEDAEFSDDANADNQTSDQNANTSQTPDFLYSLLVTGGFDPKASSTRYHPSHSYLVGAVTYWDNHDVPTNGRIPFTITNQSVQNRQYALLEAEDSIKPELVNDDVTAQYTVTAWGEKTVAESFSAPNLPLDINANQLLVAFIQPDNNLVVRVFDFNASGTTVLPLAFNGRDVDPAFGFIEQNMQTPKNALDSFHVELAAARAQHVPSYSILYRDTEQFTMASANNKVNAAPNQSISLEPPRRVPVLVIANIGGDANKVLRVKSVSVSLSHLERNILGTYQGQVPLSLKANPDANAPVPAGFDSNARPDANGGGRPGYNGPENAPRSKATVDAKLPTVISGAGYPEVRYFISVQQPQVTGVFVKSQTPFIKGGPSENPFIQLSLRPTTRPSQKEWFHIRLDGPRQVLPPSCTPGALGCPPDANQPTPSERVSCVVGTRHGATGVGAKPPILWSWNWKNVSENTCQTVYCDSVQTLMSVLSRLQHIHQLYGENPQANRDAITALKSFKAKSMDDKLTLTLRNDFDSVMRNSPFFETPNWYAGTGSPFFEFVNDPEKLAFDGQFDGSAEYQFTIDFLDDLPLFSTGSTPQARTRVRIKIEKVANSDNPAPLLRIPIDGMIGTNNPARDYGVGFSNENLPIVITQRLSERVLSQTSTGYRSVTTSVAPDYAKLNLNETARGQVLFVSPTGDRLEFAPSQATPVLWSIRPKTQNNRAFVDTYYSITRDGTPIALTNDALNQWSIRASANACRDYANQPLVHARDTPPGPGSCSLEPDSAGFRYTDLNASDANKALVLGTVFYTPLDNTTYVFAKACANDSTLLATPRAQTTGRLLDLGTSANSQISALEDILALMDDGRICIEGTPNGVEFYWNEPQFEATLDQPLQSLIQPGASAC